MYSLPAVRRDSGGYGSCTPKHGGVPNAQFPSHARRGPVRLRALIDLTVLVTWPRGGLRKDGGKVVGGLHLITRAAAFWPNCTSSIEHWKVPSIGMTFGSQWTVCYCRYTCHNATQHDTGMTACWSITPFDRSRQRHPCVHSSTRPLYFTIPIFLWVFKYLSNIVLSDSKLDDSLQKWHDEDSILECSKAIRIVGGWSYCRLSSVLGHYVNVVHQTQS